MPKSLEILNSSISLLLLHSLYAAQVNLASFLGDLHQPPHVLLLRLHRRLQRLLPRCHLFVAHRQRFLQLLDRGAVGGQVVAGDQPLDVGQVRDRRGGATPVALSLESGAAASEARQLLLSGSTLRQSLLEARVLHGQQLPQTIALHLHSAQLCPQILHVDGKVRVGPGEQAGGRGPTVEEERRNFDVFKTNWSITNSRETLSRQLEHEMLVGT